MKKTSNTGFGAALIAGSLLIFLTMVMHPSGGSMEYLLKISSVLIISHSIAIVSIPIMLYGFWGLTRRLGQEIFFSNLAFITMCLGLFAVMCAAALNGLALPLFIQHYAGATPEVIGAVKPFLRYNSSLNHAFDYVFISASCAAIILWSVAILKTGVLPKWIAYFGIVASLAAIAGLIAGFVFVDLAGFRVFIGGIIVWTVLVGRQLARD